jgi:hypothetical protein
VVNPRGTRQMSAFRWGNRDDLLAFARDQVAKCHSNMSASHVDLSSAGTDRFKAKTLV